MRALILATTIALTACTGMRTEIEHVSHPFAGKPFGPKYEEDWITQANVLLVKKSGPWYCEQGLGWKIKDQSSFRGPELTYTGRCGREWNFK